jgi:putative phage-type endonuclease
MSDLQRTPEWYAARAGKVTASRISDVVARTKSGYGASRAAYMAEIVTERLGGAPKEFFQTAAMQRGTEMEPIAKERYSIKTGLLVEDAPFVDHPTIAMSGASPDNYIGDDGLGEFKCPMSHTHFSYIESRTVPSDYFHQIQWQLACTGRQWCDFVSFDDRVPEHLQLLIIRVERDEKHIAMLEEEVAKFNAEVEKKVEYFRGVTL